MSMVKCSECGRAISQKAHTCPGCGNPVNQSFFHEGNAVTVQKTFKTWKAVKLISILAIIFGFFSFAGGETMQMLGALVILLGVIGLIVAKLGAWWTTG